MIKIESLNKKFNIATNKEVSVLKDISLSFPDTGLYIILGPSGSGKSTLISLIGAIDTPTSGSIFYNDLKVDSLLEKERNYYRQEIVSFIFQDNNLIDYLSLEDNSLLKSSASKEEAKKVFDQLGITSLIKKKPGQLSGGEKERGAIARAILSPSKVVLCDEPTASLDAENAEIVISLLKEVSKEKLVIVVSHDEELCKKYSSNIIHIHDGRIVQKEEKMESSNNPVVLDKPSKAYSKNIFSRGLKHLKHKIRYSLLMGIFSTLTIFCVSTIIGLADGSNRLIKKNTNELINYSPLAVPSYYEDLSSITLVADINNYQGTGIRVEQESDITASLHKNIITEEFVEYISKDKKPNSYFSINGDMDYSIIYQDENSAYRLFDNQLKSGINDYVSAFFGKKSVINELLYEEDYFNKKFDHLYGRYPQNENEAVVVLLRDHGVTEDIAKVLNIKQGDDPKELLNKTIYIPYHENLYNVVQSKQITGRFLKDYQTLKQEGKDVRSICNYLVKYVHEYVDGNVEEQEKALQSVNDLFKSEVETRTLNAYAKIQNKSKLEDLTKDSTKCEEIKVVGVMEVKRDMNFEEKCTGLLISPNKLKQIRERNSSSPIAQEIDQHFVMETDSLDFVVPSIVGYVNNMTHYEVSSLTDYLLKFVDFFNERTFFSVNNEISSMEFYVPDVATKEYYIEKIKQYNANTDFSSEIKYFDLTKRILSYIDSFNNVIRSSLYVIMTSALLIAVILLTVLVFDLSHSRIKEIGIYRASGYTSSYIFGLIELESLFIGLVSGFLGVGLCYIFSLILNHNVNTTKGLIAFSKIIYLDPMWIVVIIAISIVVAFITALVPSIIYSKKKPFEILKAS